MQRRDLLAAGGRVASLGAVVGLAGCLSYVYPEVSGRVTRKSIRGEADGDDRVVASLTPDGRRVVDDRYRTALGDGLRVSEPVATRLAGHYDAVVYRLRVQLDTRDPINGIPAGDANDYVVTRHAFNVAAIDASLAGRVARFGRDRLIRVEGAGIRSGSSQEG